MGRDDIGLLEAGAADDAGLVKRLTDLVNEVYDTAERGLWREGATRTTTGELAALIREGRSPSPPATALRPA